MSVPPASPEEEKKHRLEEIKKRLRELRARIERWAMVKISDVSEMNAVYREIGEILRELLKLNPHPEAISLKREAEELRNRVEKLMSSANTRLQSIEQIFERAIARSLKPWTDAEKRRVLDLVRSVISNIQQGRASPEEAYYQLIGIAYDFAVPLGARDISEIRRILGVE